MTKTISRHISPVGIAANAISAAQSDNERAAAMAALKAAQQEEAMARIAQRAKDAARAERRKAMGYPVFNPITRTFDAQKAVPDRVTHSGAKARLDYLERAERGGNVNRQHCPPFEPMGRRLQRDGLLTLHRSGMPSCRHSYVLLTAKGRATLAALRKKMGVSAPSALV